MLILKIFEKIGIGNREFWRVFSKPEKKVPCAKKFFICVNSANWTVKYQSRCSQPSREKKFGVNIWPNRGVIKN